MGRFIGGRFGSIVSIVPNNNAPSGVYTINDQYYSKQDGGWILPPLGSTSSRPATSAQAIIDAGDSTGNGFYWIQTTSGMANPVQIWCDMTTQTGVGWMRFWWYGKAETGGADPSNDFVAQDQLGIADISTIAYDAMHGRGRIPAGQTINGIMVKGNSGPNPKLGDGKLRYAIWNTTSPGNIPASSTNTEYNTLLAFQSGTTSSSANTGSWFPASHNLADNTSISGADRADSFYYYDYGSQGYKSFNLDDDHGYCITAFSAGYDGGGTGVDVFDNNSNCATNTSSGRNLNIFWR